MVATARACWLGQCTWFPYHWKSWGAVGILLGGILLGVGCRSGEQKERAEGGLRIGVAIEPVAFLVHRVADPYVQVHVVIPSGGDAHTFQLTPRQVADLAKVDLFFRVGLALEDRMLEKLRQARRDFRVIDLAQGIARRHFHPEERHAHLHEGSEEAQEPGHSASSSDPAQPPGHLHEDAEEVGHSRDAEASERPHPKGSGWVASEESTGGLEGESAGRDPHIWLSPPLLKVQAQRIVQALSEHDPAHQEHYRRKLTELESELDGLDAWIRQQLAPYQGRAFFVFHPSFGYFADCYGLRQVAIQVEGRTPAPQELRQWIELAQKEHASLILVQPQFDPRPARIVAEAIGARLAEINDLDREILATLRSLAQTLAEAFAVQPKRPPTVQYPREMVPPSPDSRKPISSHPKEP